MVSGDRLLMCVVARLAHTIKRQAKSILNRMVTYGAIPCPVVPCDTHSQVTQINPHYRTRSCGDADDRLIAAQPAPVLHGLVDPDCAAGALGAALSFPSDRRSLTRWPGWRSRISLGLGLTSRERGCRRVLTDGHRPHVLVHAYVLGDPEPPGAEESPEATAPALRRSLSGVRRDRALLFEFVAGWDVPFLFAGVHAHISCAYLPSPWTTVV